MIPRVKDDGGDRGIREQIVADAFENAVRAVAMAETKVQHGSVPLARERFHERGGDARQVLRMNKTERAFPVYSEGL